jgi:hypothetical protein
MASNGEATQRCGDAHSGAHLRHAQHRDSVACFSAPCVPYDLHLPVAECRDVPPATHFPQKWGDAHSGAHLRHAQQAGGCFTLVSSATVSSSDDTMKMLHESMQALLWQS